LSPVLFSLLISSFHTVVASHFHSKISFRFNIRLHVQKEMLTLLEITLNSITYIDASKIHDEQMSTEFSNISYRHFDPFDLSIFRRTNIVATPTSEEIASMFLNVML